VEPGDDLFTPVEDDAYRVHTEFFDGPLDLLLHLIRKNRMNIMDVRISVITAEYLSYLQENKGINPSREGDFLMTASTLIYIKSRSLLPRPEALLDEESPEEKLRHALIEYDKVQKISHILKEMEGETLLLWKREEVMERFDHQEFDIAEVSSFQLAEVFLNLVRRKEREEFLYIEAKSYSIEEKLNEILALLNEKGFINFAEYVAGLQTIEDVLVSFFTVLEMVRKHFIIAVQKKLFEPISIWKKEAENEIAQ